MIRTRSVTELKKSQYRWLWFSVNSLKVEGSGTTKASNCSRSHPHNFRRNEAATKVLCRGSSKTRFVRNKKLSSRASAPQAIWNWKAIDLIGSYFISLSSLLLLRGAAVAVVVGGSILVAVFRHVSTSLSLVKFQTPEYLMDIEKDKLSFEFYIKNYMNSVKPRPLMKLSPIY